MKSIRLGKIAGLDVEILLAAFWATDVLWLGLAAAAYFGIGLPPLDSLLLGLSGALLHWISGLVHHLGHVYAAYSTGHPMSGLQIGVFGLLARDLYPADEPELSGATHIRRALGGPLASALLTLLFFLLLPLWPGSWYWLGLFALLENGIVFTLQVFLPLPFNDGGAVLRGLRQIAG